MSTESNWREGENPYNKTLADIRRALIQKTEAQQRAKLTAYRALLGRGLPVPPDLKRDCEDIIAELP